MTFVFDLDLMTSKISMYLSTACTSKDTKWVFKCKVTEVQYYR